MARLVELRHRGVVLPMKPLRLEAYVVGGKKTGIYNTNVKPPKNAASKKPTPGIKWRCTKCAATYPCWETKKGELTHSPECVDHVGCPLCLNGDDAERAALRVVFDPVKEPKLAEKGEGLKEGEYAVSWQFKYPPRRRLPETLKKSGQVVHMYRTSDFWTSATDEEELAAPEGLIIRDYASAYTVSQHIGGGGFQQSRPRKYLRVVDHTGQQHKLEDVVEEFAAHKTPDDVRKVTNARTLVKGNTLIVTHTAKYEADDPSRELKKISPGEIEQIFEAITGLKMSDEHGRVVVSDADAEVAFEKRRESIRRDGAPHVATRLFHGTHAHNIRSILQRGLQRSAVATDSALGPGIYLGELKKARGFSRPCCDDHFLEGFVEGERIGRRIHGTGVIQNFGPLSPVAVNRVAGSAMTMNIAAKQLASKVSTRKQSNKRLRKMANTFVQAGITVGDMTDSVLPAIDKITQMLKEEMGEEFYARLAAKARPDNLLSEQVRKLIKRTHAWDRVRFVLEADVLLGTPYEALEALNNDSPRRFLRRGCHSVYCRRFRQDEWCVYRPDQVIIRRVNVFVDDDLLTT